MDQHYHLPTELARFYYPPPPWVLRGSGLIATFRVQAEQVRALVPEPLSLVSLPGGLAMGYLAVWRYGAGSTLEYSELLAGVMARHRLRFGPYVTHIGVNTRPSQRAGRELWYLPKELWEFDWTFGEQTTEVRVWDGARLICVVGGAPSNARFLPLRTSLTFLNLRGTQVATIKGDFDVGIAPVPWDLQIGPDGPLLALTPAGRRLSFALKGVAEVQPLEVQEQ